MTSGKVSISAIIIFIIVVGLIVWALVDVKNSPVASAPTQQDQTAVTNTNPMDQTTGDAANTQTLADGLQITVEQAGSGPAVKAGDTVSVNYTGTLADGTVFDASANHGGPIDFPIGVGQVIKGWDEGIVGMQVGEKRMLVIPPALAYGAQGIPGTIPPNATLTFEVELVAIK